MPLCISFWIALWVPQWSSARSDRGKTAGHVQVAIGGGPIDRAGRQKVSVILQIEKGYHLIGRNVTKDLEPARLRIEFSQNGKAVQASSGYPFGKKVKDEILGDYTIYQGEVMIIAEVRRAPGETGPLEAVIRMQGYPDILAY
jgi:hypothetical protein